MALPSPMGLSRSLFARAARRGVVLGAVAAALTASTVPLMTGCKAVPLLISAAVTLCESLLARIFDEPVGALPPGYAQCEQNLWRARGVEIKFCLYCSPNPADPVYIQLNCEGKFFPIKIPPRQAARDRSGSFTADGVHLSKLNCDEYVLTLAQAIHDEQGSHADVSIVVPNDRVLPSIRRYQTLIIEIDGIPARPNGTTLIKSGSAVRVEGDFNEVARYCAEAGVRSIEFNDGLDAWAVEVNPDFATIAIFKNAVFIEARFLFSPAE